MSEHTSIPWRVQHGVRRAESLIWGTVPGNEPLFDRPNSPMCNSGEYIIAIIKHCNEDEPDAGNADFIVRACNAHDKMLETLRDVAHWIRTCPMDGVYMDEEAALKDIYDTIALATKGE